MNANNQEKAATIINLITKDVESLLDTYKENADNPSDLTLDVVFRTDGFGDRVLSITYDGYVNVKDAAYPTSFYHSINIDLVDAYIVPMYYLFAIDSVFVGAFTLGTYAPYSEHNGTRNHTIYSNLFENLT